ncbi:DUF2812 domain-containing protein [Romboutsia weinsteinii]|nr:DUF2812 domain-containing protein [Romboutsia weinsteinii]
MKKVIKPFWTYNIVKIEKWLSEMISRGYILKDVNILTRVFVFEKSENKKVSYKISYENVGVNDINNSLKKEGWNRVVSKNRWMFSCTDKNNEDIKISPSREGILKRNKVIKYFLFFISLLYFGMYIPVLLILGFASLGVVLGFIPVEYDNSIVVDPSISTNETMIGPVVFFSILIFIFYTILKLNKLDKEIRKELGYNKKKYMYDVEEVSNKDKQIKKFKPAWQYAPDKLEKWLDDMESKGYNLYKVNKIGAMFYFTKGQSRKIKYIVDYQNSTDEGYFEIHKEDGWKLNFKSIGSITTWSIWSKEYDDTVPEIYTNNEDLLKYAKKTLIINTITLLPALVIFTSLLCQDIYFVMNGLTPIYSVIIKIVVIIEFAIFYNSSLKYYFRTKKKIIH